MKENRKISSAADHKVNLGNLILSMRDNEEWHATKLQDPYIYPHHGIKWDKQESTKNGLKRMRRKLHCTLHVEVAEFGVGKWRKKFIMTRTQKKIVETTLL